MDSNIDIRIEFSCLDVFSFYLLSFIEFNIILDFMLFNIN